MEHRKKTLKISLFLSIFLFISTSAYCIYLDNVNPKEVKAELEIRKRRVESKLQQEKEQKLLKEASKVNLQKPRLVESKEEDRPKSKKTLVFFLIIFVGIAGYLFYRYKNR